MLDIKTVESISVVLFWGFILSIVAYSIWGDSGSED